MKTKFPLIEGFQDTLLQKKHAFEVVSGEFIQIINKSNSHWVTLSNLGIQQHGTIRIYDSLNSPNPSTDFGLLSLYPWINNAYSSISSIIESRYPDSIPI